MDGRESLQTEFVKRHFADASAWLLEAWQKRKADYVSAFAKNFDSPLEVAFFVWWSAAEQAGVVNSHVIDLYMQYQVDVSGGERFRLDLAILPRPDLIEVLRSHGLPLRAVAVELDGHDFHERTKEQVTYRNRRDRALAADGWTVLHFSGSEFHRSPLGCVKEASERGFAAVMAIRDELSARGISY